MTRPTLIQTQKQKNQTPRSRPKKTPIYIEWEAHLKAIKAKTDTILETRLLFAYGSMVDILTVEMCRTGQNDPPIKNLSNLPWPAMRKTLSIHNKSHKHHIKLMNLYNRILQEVRSFEK